MAEWTHNLCERCWFTSDDGVLGDGRFQVPTRVKDSNGVCCGCGTPTVSGIYVRRNEDDLLCGGEHEHVEYWSPIVGQSIPAGRPEQARTDAPPGA